MNEPTLTELLLKSTEERVSKPQPWHPVSTFLFNLIWASAFVTIAYFITHMTK